ncbi:MAG: hypothetical protein KC561_05355 [Myxococcales bacterium]|nr:hypothetical protein [Myxococcales bacterium]
MSKENSIAWLVLVAALLSISACGGNSTGGSFEGTGDGSDQDASVTDSVTGEDSSDASVSLDFAPDQADSTQLDLGPDNAPDAAPDNVSDDATEDSLESDAGEDALIADSSSGDTHQTPDQGQTADTLSSDSAGDLSRDDAVLDTATGDGLPEPLEPDEVYALDRIEDIATEVIAVLQSTLDMSDGYSIRLAQPLTVPASESWTVRQLIVRGAAMEASDLSQGVNVWIYGSDGDDIGLPVWQAFAWQGFSVDADSEELNMVITLEIPNVHLGAGDYWVSVQPIVSSADERWYWGGSIANGSRPLLVEDPDDTLSEGCTEWTDAQPCFGLIAPGYGSLEVFGTRRAGVLVSGDEPSEGSVPSYATGAASVRVADDFVVPEGQTWNLNRISLVANVRAQSAPPVEAATIRFYESTRSDQPGEEIAVATVAATLTEIDETGAELVLDFPDQEFDTGTYWFSVEAHAPDGTPFLLQVAPHPEGSEALIADPQGLTESGPCSDWANLGFCTGVTGDLSFSLFGTRHIDEVPSSFAVRVLIESFTGTWGQYCTDITRLLNEMDEAYPGRYVHVSVHYDDELEVPDGAALVDFTHSIAFPNGIIHRHAGTLNARTDWALSSAPILAAGPAACGLQINNQFDTSVEVWAACSTVPEGDLRVGVVWIEDDVMSAQPQLNYYSGEDHPHGSDPFEIPDYLHPAVLRGSPTGTVSGVSVELSNGVATRLAFARPDDVCGVRSNCSAVAYIYRVEVEGETTRHFILNAVEVPLGDAYWEAFPEE